MIRRCLQMFKKLSPRFDWVFEAGSGEALDACCVAGEQLDLDPKSLMFQALTILVNEAPSGVVMIDEKVVTWRKCHDFKGNMIRYRIYPYDRTQDTVKFEVDE